MSTATISAVQEQENARINAENERLRKQATTKRRISLGLSYFALILITILMLFPTGNRRAGVVYPECHHADLATEADSELVYAGKLYVVIPASANWQGNA